MIRLRVSRVRSSSRLSGALLPGEAGEYGSFDGEILEVGEEGVASELANYHNVEVVSSRAKGGGNAAGTAFQCGESKSDGEPCERTVDGPNEMCWQHN